ncbi:hypothetical protein [Curtobacterium sp. ISL-83]|uniref:hypothetical protein n=1 Tax=Curtobacterium sp. ISL-83 TaxID=2819145 RepID=UPI001BE8CDC7|nr:hypothetical protein [Curtobacterium sp. ISL-83]MBT2503454.1 hypothetical protein [Curtobacterium sp. ISL-83]
MTQQRGGAIVPSRAVHTDVVFVVLAVTGVAALLAGAWGAFTGPGPNDIPDWAVICLMYGITAGVAGCIGAPLIIGIARRDRATLALVQTHRPRALALPGAVSNHTLLRSLRALSPSAPTPRSVVWAVDEHGMELWQPQSVVPVLTVPWERVVSTSTDLMPQGRAVIAVAVLNLGEGHQLRFALRRRFGGITLMGRDRLDDVLRDFAEVAQPTAGTHR